MNSRSKKEHESLISTITQHRAAISRVEQEMADMNAGTRIADAASHEKLDALSTKAGATQASIMSLRSLGEHLMENIRQFPKEIRDLLRSILRSNWQMYQVLLQIQQRTSNSPTGLLDSNIKFEDALGEYRELPYEYFRHWEVLISLHLLYLNLSCFTSLSKDFFVPNSKTSLERPRFWRAYTIL